MYLRFILLFLGVAYLLNSCGTARTEPGEYESYADPSVSFDLSDIKERGKLVLLTENSSTSYYLYRGRPFGYDYELIREFARDLGVDLEVKIIPDLNNMFKLLREGEGDIVACNLTITQERKRHVNFSKTLMDTKQVLVQRKPKGWEEMSEREIEKRLIREPSQLAGKQVFVHRYSSFYERLVNLQAEMGKEIDIVEASGGIDSEKLISLVASGDIHYTVADENVARLNQTYFPILDVSTSISLSQEIGWATRKNAPELLKAMNDWLYDRENSRTLAYTYNKYFEHTKSQMDRVTSSYSSLHGDRLSEWDEHIKKYSQEIGWDWELIAALINQESRFNPEARSWVGAFGLMQLMPYTAERFGVDTTQKGVANIQAGVRYIKFLNKIWKNRIVDEDERKKFILASYNVGPGHVFDAQKIAEQLNMDPLIWEGNVAECLLLKSKPEYYQMEGVKHGYCRGAEPYHYVKNVLEYYQQYLAMNL